MTKIIIGNWKMYPTFSDAMVLASTLKKSLEEVSGVEIVLAPPTAWLVPVVEAWRHKASNIHFAAQNIFPLDQGAYTGESSAFMLKNIISYAIVGHSERRRYQGEDNELINNKVQACLRWQIKPVLCVGEAKRIIDGDGKIDSYQWGKVAEQLMEALSGVKPDDFDKVIVAYEPVWAVGSKRAATPEYTLQIIEKLQSKLSEKYPKRSAEEIRFIYGGDVEVDNVSDFLKHSEISGVLLGRESVKTRDFAQICRLATRQ